MLIKKGAIYGTFLYYSIALSIIRKVVVAQGFFRFTNVFCHSKI